MKRVLFIILFTIPFIGFGQGLIGYYVDESTDDLWKTTDGGVTFNVVNYDLVYTPSSVEFVNEMIGYYVDESTDDLWKTTDGGVTFNVVNYDLVYTPSSVEFIDENITSVFDITIPSSKRELIKTVDILGRETKPNKNTPFIEIYDDGSTEKKIVIE